MRGSAAVLVGVTLLLGAGCSYEMSDRNVSQAIDYCVTVWGQDASDKCNEVVTLADTANCSYAKTLIAVDALVSGDDISEGLSLYTSLPPTSIAGWGEGYQGPYGPISDELARCYEGMAAAASDRP